MSKFFSRGIHILFLLLGIVLFFRTQYDQALIFSGLALAFDPFDTTQKWHDRPIWQRAVLIVEVLFVFTALALGFGFK